MNTHTTALVRAAAACVVFHACAATSASELEQTLDLAPGFPRTIFFRSERELLGMSTEDAVAAMAAFDAVSLKLFNEAARMRFRDLLPAVQALKRSRPRMPVLVHVDHFAHVRPLEGERLSPGRTFARAEPLGMFPGHWLYYPGSTIVRPIGPSGTRVPVADASRFCDGDDVRLWPADARQQPAAWRQSEVVFVEKVDEARSLLTVQRGKYATAARAFPAGSMASPHYKMRYGNPAWYWSYNLAPLCPRDEEGRHFAAWFAHWLANEIKGLNAHAGFRYIDGVEFDVTKFNLVTGKHPLEGMPAKTAKRRAPDCDLDGVGDGGYVDGQPGHGFGTIDCIRRLRESLGPGYLITGDSIWTLWRAWPYANGMDNESFPDIRKPYRWSGAFERTADWQRRCAEPRMSFFFTRAGHDGLPGQRDAHQTLRLALATALLLDCWHCNMGLPGGVRRPDEYDGGALRKPHWLGRPMEDFVRLPQPRGQDRLGYGRFEREADVSRARVAAQPGYRVDGPKLDGQRAREGQGCLRVTVAALPHAPAEPRTSAARLRLPVAVEAGQEYTVSFWARAEHDYARHEPACRGVPWGMTVSLWSGRGGRPNTGQHCLLVPDSWRRFHLSIAANPGSPNGRVEFEIGAEPGTLWLDDVCVHQGGADVFYRRFEHGLVLVNASRSPARFDLARIEPSRELARLKATQEQGAWRSDPTVNTGQPAPKDRPLELGPWDGLLLRVGGD